MDFVGVEVAAVFAQVLVHLGLHEVLGGGVWGVLDSLLELPRHAVPNHYASRPENTKRFNFWCSRNWIGFLHQLLHLDDDVGRAIVQGVVVKKRSFYLDKIS